ncbi:MAG: ribonuclease R, partial [Methylocella sp.]
MKTSAGARESARDITEPAHAARAARDKTLPSRADILAFIAGEREAFGGEAQGKIGKREIARAFGIKGPARIALKRMLKDLEVEGAIERRRKSLHKPGLLQGVVLADMIARDRDGDLLAAAAEWDTGQGPAPQILVMTKARQKPGPPAPAPGDRALMRVERVPGAEPGEPAYTGRVVKLLPRAKTQVLGIFRADPRGGGRIVPIDKKNVNRGEVSVGPGDE